MVKFNVQQSVSEDKNLVLGAMRSEVGVHRLENDHAQLLVWFCVGRTKY